MPSNKPCKILFTYLINKLNCFGLIVLFATVQIEANQNII